MNTPHRLVTSLYLISLLLASDVASQSVRYYRHADLRLNADYLFRYEVTGRDTSRANVYRCTYDTIGRLVRWEYLKAGVLDRDLVFDKARAEISYHSNGTSLRYFSELGLPLISDLNGKCGVREYRSAKGDSVWTYYYLLHGAIAKKNDFGCTSRLMVEVSPGQFVDHCLDSNKQPQRDEYGVFEYHYTADSIGRVLTSSTHDHDGSLLDPSDGREAKAIYTYDVHGNRINTSLFDRNNLPLRPAGAGLTIYDVFGYPVRYNTGTGGTVIQCTLTYDKLGNVLTSQVHHPHQAPSLLNKAEYVYDSLNRPVEYREINGENKLVFAERRRYNGLGKISELFYVDYNGRLITGPYGVAFSKFVYNDHGIRVQEESFGPDSTRVLHQDGYSIVEYEFNEYGQTTAKMYRGADGKFIDLPNGEMAVTRHFYDENGTWLGRTETSAENAGRTSLFRMMLESIREQSTDSESTQGPAEADTPRQ